MDTVLEFLNKVVSSFQSIPPETWAGLATILTGGLVVSVVTELVKRRRINKKQVDVAKSFLGFVLTGLSGVVTLAQSLIVYGTINPGFLGTHTPQVLGAASAVYLFGGSKVYRKVANFTTRLKKAFDSLEPTTTTGVPVNLTPVEISGTNAVPVATPVSDVVADVLS